MTKMIVRKEIPSFLYKSFEVEQKHQLYSHLVAMSASYGSSGNKDGTKSGYMDFKGKFMYLFHAEKVRAKIQRTWKYRPSLVKSNQHIGSIGKVTKRGHWKVRIFKIDMDLILSARQYDRTFKVVLK